MFEEALSRDAQKALAVLGESGILSNAYLAGGTALALRLGHRLSIDLDFFTREKFSEKELVEQLSSLPIDFKLEKLAQGTILGYVGKTQFSLFFYDYDWLEKPKEFSGIKIAGVKDIASMKLLAISDRGAKRDFIDLYFIVAVKKLYSLEEIFSLYDKKFKVLLQNKAHILKSLTYFKEADDASLPRMLKEVDWSAVKKFFTGEVRRIVNSTLAV